MRLPVLMALLALATPAWAQHSTTHAAAAHAVAAEQGVAHVRVTARILVVDRDALTRAGLDYLVLGNDRVRVSANGRNRARGVRVGVGTHGVSAFLEAIRENRWVRSESTQQVLTISGGEGVVSSTDLAAGRYASRTRGPSLVVSPSVLADGSVHLRVSARHEDSIRYAWGYGVDGSPAAVETEVVARDGEELLLASSSSTQSTRQSGLLSWGTAEQGREVLVAVSAEIVHH